MARISLKVNGKSHGVDTDPDTPLLYVLRDDLELNGPRFGCGLAQCGACTVILAGSAVRSCTLSGDRAAKNQEITTLEGLGSVAHPHPAPDSVHRRAGRAVRLLHERHDHERQSLARQESSSERGEIKQSARTATSAAAEATCA